MLVLNNLEQSGALEPSVVVIGFFDGVHRGHQAILQTAGETGRQRGARVRVITFEEHPSLFFRPGARFQYLTTIEEKSAILSSMAVDVVHLVPFDATIANTEAADFCATTLVAGLNMRALVVGHDFAMGKNRAGTIPVLRELGRALKFAVVPVGAVMSQDGAPISSTRIRALVSGGDTALAAELMGHPYTLSGTAIPGRGLGRQIGFPTLNLEWNPCKILPATGVYATIAIIDNELHPAVTNVGYRPTVGGEGLSIETHLTAATPPATIGALTLQFITRLRAEQKFDSIADLTHQIAQDTEQAEEYFAL